MTLDTDLRTQLTTAVDDTTVPPGLGARAVAGGRRRRRLRAGGALALATVAAVGGSLLLPGGGPLARDAHVAGGGTVTSKVALTWARSLPRGEAPALPFFGEGGLWSDGRMYDAPDEVDHTYPPREVVGGWLVLTGQYGERSGLAVMSPDMSLRELPGDTFGQGVVDARVEVSPDGRRVAYGSWVVDLETMQATPVPHQPESDSQDGFSTAMRMVGFIDDGLVYEGAPFDDGVGTTWLLRADGSTVEVQPPGGRRVGDDTPADFVVDYSYAADDSDTCVTSYVLRDEAWAQDGRGCMGRSLEEALAVSPDHRWLLTDDLPEIWNLEDGSWAKVDIPADVGRVQMDAQMGGAVWETADTFLLPVADRWSGAISPAPAFVQHVQVVRCAVSTGACERAGDEQYLPVTSTTWGTTELRFARS